jgi:hypothetical protein
MLAAVVLAGCGGAPETAGSMPVALGPPPGAGTGGFLVPAVGDGSAPPAWPAFDRGLDGAGLPSRLVWKAAIVAGDDRLDAFDNARATVHGLFIDEGVLGENAIQLSRARDRERGVSEMSFENLLNGMLRLDVGAADGCAVFMTSHGSQSGFLVEGRGDLSPTDLARILDESCGDRPTVVMVSACYSGVFIAPLARPNRIILTAARSDRTSFGCMAGATYTYWDGCLIERFPAATTWAELYESVTQCVEQMEAGVVPPSEPQAFFGDDVRNLAIFYRK